MKTRPFLIHALSPLHPGTGQSVDVIDLPIARMRSTGIPILPGSSIKGRLRDARHDVHSDKEVFAVFGPEVDKASDHAGAIVVGDARLLALPVRSFFGTFAWVSSPLLLRLAWRDLQGNATNVPSDIPSPGAAEARVTQNTVNLSRDINKVYLEDLDISAQRDNKVDNWASYLAPKVFPEAEEVFTKRFVVVDDETMTFLWETATQIDTRIRLDDTTRTVAKGALWIEESLPPETLLIGVLSASGSRKPGVNLGPEDVLDVVLGEESLLQFGGSTTIGRGRSRMVPFNDAQEEEEAA